MFSPMSRYGFSVLGCFALTALALPAFASSEPAGWGAGGTSVVDAAYLLQLALGLLVVLVAIVLLAFVMRRMTGMQAALGREFRVLGGISLGARERMVLVQVGEKQLLVGVAPGRVQTLHVLEEPIRADAPDAGAAGAATVDSPFAQRLRSILQRNP